MSTRARVSGDRRGSTRRITATANDLPPAVQWHEGMLLAPQHFQQATLRQEQLLYYHAALLSPYHWGVRHLRLDPVLLVDGTFRVLELEAVMPDSLIVSAQAEDAAELTLDLAPHLDELKQRPLPVHVAVAAKRRGVAAAEGEMARYESVEGYPVADENSGRGELRVPRLVPRLRLLLTDDPPAKYVSFPIAEVAYANETFALTEFVPPTLEVATHTPLGEACAALATRLREKAIFLADQVHTPSVAVRMPQLLETRATIHSLVAALPPFEALVASGAAHPFPLYLALCHLAGQAAAICRALVPPVLDPYDHNDLRTTFDGPLKFISQVLDEGILETYTAYPFQAEDGAFRLDFDPAWEGRRLVLGVRAREGASEQQLLEWVDSALIGSLSRIPSLREKRIVGAPRQPLDADRDLVPARGIQLFALTPDPEFVDADEPLEVRNLDDPDGAGSPLEILLYVKKDTAAAAGQQPPPDRAVGPGGHDAAAR